MRQTTGRGQLTSFDLIATRSHGAVLCRTMLWPLDHSSMEDKPNRHNGNATGRPPTRTNPNIRSSGMQPQSNDGMELTNPRQSVRMQMDDASPGFIFPIQIHSTSRRLDHAASASASDRAMAAGTQQERNDKAAFTSSLNLHAPPLLVPHHPRARAELPPTGHPNGALNILFSSTSSKSSVGMPDRYAPRQPTRVIVHPRLVLRRLRCLTRSRGVFPIGHRRAACRSSARIPTPTAPAGALLLLGPPTSRTPPTRLHLSWLRTVDPRCTR